MVHWSLPRRGFPLNCAQYNRGRRCGFGRETGEICINSDPCGEKRKKLKKCREKTAEKVQNFAGEVQVLQGGFCGGSVPGFLRRILLGFCEDSAQSENAAPAREKASWRRWEVQFQGATGLPRRRCCGAKPRHTNSAPQERGRLVGFREDPDLPQGMIAWYCGASQGKASWRRRKVQFRGAIGLPRRRFCGAKLAVYLLHADSA